MLSIKTMILTKQGNNKIHLEIVSQQHVSYNMICFSLWLKKYTTKLRGLEPILLDKLRHQKTKFAIIQLPLFLHDLD